MDKKIGKLKTVIYVTLTVSAFNFLIMLPILCAVNGVGIWELLHNKDIVFGLVGGLVSGIGIGIGSVIGSGFVFGFVGGLVFGIGIGIVSGLFFGIGIGISAGFYFWFMGGLFFGFVGGLVSGIGIGIGFVIAFSIGFGIASGIGIGISIGFICGIVSGIGVGLAYEIFVVLVGGLVSVVNGGISGGIAYGLAYFVIFLSIRKLKLLPLLKALPKAVKQTLNGIIHPSQLKEYSIGSAIASFIIIYVFTILIFSLWFYTIYLEDYSKHFNINSETGIGCLDAAGNGIRFLYWWHFIYFSVVTIATVGYGDISPMSIIPQLLVVIEILVGFGLVAFYLATIFQIIARIEPKDESLKLQEMNRQISELKNEMVEFTKQNQRRSRATTRRRDRRRR